MSFKILTTAFSVCVVAILSASTNVVAAESGDRVNPETWLISKSGFYRAGTDIVVIRDRLIQFHFYSVDADGNGISQSDFDLLDDLESARRRARHVTPLLQRDLNGDGRITKQELEKFFLKQATRPMRSGLISIQPTEAQIRDIQQRLVQGALRADQNKDGVLDFAELMADAENNNRKQRWRGRYDGRIPWSFDANKDGVIALSEFEMVVDRVVATLDQDRDGVASEREIKNFRALGNAARRELRNRSGTIFERRRIKPDREL